MKPSEKNKYGHLLYSLESVRRAEHIHILQQLGFKLKEINEIIDAPNEIKKQDLVRRLRELELEKSKLDSIIEEANKFIEKI